MDVPVDPLVISCSYMEMVMKNVAIWKSLEITETTFFFVGQPAGLIRTRTVICCYGKMYQPAKN